MEYGGLDSQVCKGTEQTYILKESLDYGQASCINNLYTIALVHTIRIWPGNTYTY